MPTGLKESTGVTAMLKAQHRSSAGNIHAHEWEITAIWHKRRDALVARWDLNNSLSQYEGKCLPDRLAAGEDLAREIMHELGCNRVEVRRHAEGIYAEARL
jgi:hypothetical protein